VDPVQIDPYTTLGVREDASPEVVARAYHRLAKELHPDLRGEATAQRMREVNAAWDILSDPNKRAAWGRGQQVVAAGSHWAPRTAAARPSSLWAERPAGAEARPEAIYPRRPHVEDRRWTDSPWLVGAIAPAIVVAVLVIAGILSAGDRQTLADRFEGFRTQEAFPLLNRAVAGSAVRVTFGMGGFVGYDLLADGSPASTDYACENGATGAPDIQATANVSSSSFAYSPAGHTYVYTWKTESSWVGTCRELTFAFRDGSSRSALFDFRPAAAGFPSAVR